MVPKSKKTFITSINQYIEHFMKLNLNLGKLYWIPFLISVLLGYAFKVFNVALTADDELLNEYHELGFYLQGRWTFSFWAKLLHAESFSPGWTDILAILLAILGIFFLSAVIKSIVSEVPNYILGIAAGITITYPYIATYIVMMGYALPFGFQMAFCGLACFSLCRFIKHKEVLIDYIILLVSIVFSGAEVILPILITMYFILATLVSIENKGEVAFGKIVISGMKVAITMVLGLLIFRFISSAVFHGSSYGLQSYMTYSIGNGIKDFADQVLTIFVELFELYATSIQLPIVIFRVATCLNICIGILYLIKERNWMPLLFIVVATFFSLSLYIITGNININERMLYWQGLYIFLSIINLAVLMMHQKQILRSLIVIPVIYGTFLMIYQTNEMNRLFYADYRTYQWDKQFAIELYKDIMKVTNNIDSGNLLVCGYLDQPSFGKFQAGTDYENIDTSLFQAVRYYSIDLEYGSGRIVRFMNMMNGSNFKEAIDVRKEEITIELGKMPSWPNDGYIKFFDNLILVKLGDSMLEEKIGSREDFYLKYAEIGSGDVQIVPVVTDDGYIRIENNSPYSSFGWAVIEGEASDNSRVQLALVGEKRQYLMFTQRYYNEVPNQIYNDYFYDKAGFVTYYFPAELVKMGDYEIDIIITTSSNQYIVRTNKIFYKR